MPRCCLRVTICGTGLECVTDFLPRGKVGLRRERLLDSNVPSTGTPCGHEHTATRVFGNGRPGNYELRGPGYAKVTREGAFQVKFRHIPSDGPVDGGGRLIAGAAPASLKGETRAETKE